MSENKELQLISTDNIKDKIYTIRGVQVMLDSDLANIYGYSTKDFNRQVKNNIEKFPSDMMFELTKSETKEILRCKNFTSSWGGQRYSFKVFTEQGIYMLMTVLKGELATKQSLALVRLFKEMKQYIINNSLVFQRLDRVELKQIETDEKFKEIFKCLEQPKEVKAVMFFKGQMYDASTLIKDLISSAKSDIILIDNYTDRKTLDCFVYKKKGVSATVYTQKDNCKILQSEITDFNLQYGSLILNYIKDYHDRFLIIDKTKLYHIGASLKDCGKKAFAISEIEDTNILNSILFVESCGNLKNSEKKKLVKSFQGIATS